jgi:integrase
MTRTRNQLTDRQVQTAKDGWHADGGNLYLRVADEGRRRSWVLRYTANGRTTELGLGAAATVSLKKARAKRDELLDKRADGLDPLEEKRKAEDERAKRKTFGEIAAAVLALNASLGATSRAEWARHLEGACKPLAARLVEEISVDDIKRIVAPYWDQGKHESARRLLGRIETVLSYAIAHGYRSSSNVAAWSVFKHITPKTVMNGDKPHHAAVLYADMPALMAKLRAVDTMASLALQFAILCAARAGEARMMTWDEVDLDAETWTVPKERMKARVEHSVPLSADAVAILRKLAEVRTGALVFPGRLPRKPLTNGSIWDLVKRLAGDENIEPDERRLSRGDATTHGMRSAFRDWCGDATQVPREVAEAALAHKVGSASEQAYRRSSALEKRRALMSQWADFLNAKAGEGKVVPLRKRS